MQQQQIQAQQQIVAQEQQFKDKINQRDNDTKIMVAQINSQAEMAVLQMKNNMTQADLAEKDGIEPVYSQEAKNKLMEEMRQFDEKLKQSQEELKFKREKLDSDTKLKERQLNR